MRRLSAENRHTLAVGSSLLKSAVKTLSLINSLYHFRKESIPGLDIDLIDGDLLIETHCQRIEPSRSKFKVVADSLPSFFCMHKLLE